jgi:hypothetical protein
MRNFTTFTLCKIWNDQVKENEMDMACSTNGDEACIKDIGGKARRKEATRKTKTCVDNTKMDFGEIGWGGMDCIDLAQDRDH